MDVWMHVIDFVHKVLSDLDTVSFRYNILSDFGQIFFYYFISRWSRFSMAWLVYFLGLWSVPFFYCSSGGNIQREDTTTTFQVIIRWSDPEELEVRCSDFRLPAVGRFRFGRRVLGLLKTLNRRSLAGASDHIPITEWKTSLMRSALLQSIVRVCRLSAQAARGRLLDSVFRCID